MLQQPFWRTPQLAGRLLARADEVRDIEALLMEHAAADLPQALLGALSRAIARASLGDRHLWEDLGLQSRAELGEIMDRYFPGLATRNTQGMRWKKFLYRELCIREDVLICRSPSCATCEERQACFGPEEPASPG